MDPAAVDYLNRLDTYLGHIADAMNADEEFQTLKSELEDKAILVGVAEPLFAIAVSSFEESLLPYVTLGRIKNFFRKLLNAVNQSKDIAMKNYLERIDIKTFH